MSWKVTGNLIWYLVGYFMYSNKLTHIFEYIINWYYQINLKSSWIRLKVTDLILEHGHGRKALILKWEFLLSLDWMKMSKCWSCKQNSRWWWWLFINIIDRCVIRVQCLLNQLNGGSVKEYQCKIISGRKPFIARKI